MPANLAADCGRLRARNLTRRRAWQPRRAGPGATVLEDFEDIAMARVRMIKPEEADADTRKVYDGVVRQWGRISNFSQVLAHQPAALAGWMLPNEAIRLAKVKSDPDYVKIQQLVIIKTSALNRSAYCMSHNVTLGKKIGLSEE